MALGTSDNQQRFDDPASVLGDRLKEVASHGWCKRLEAQVPI
jgi:hypothetical protein